jgi:DNA-binding transcriptional ArsR family regulator
MTTPFERLADLDRLIHEPARLAILSALSACTSADFLFLQRITGLSKGNLSSHVARLEEAGLIVVSKEFVGRTPRTTVKLTPAGRDRVTTHWQDLEQLGRAARRWRPS